MSRVYIIGAGICTPLGQGIREHLDALRNGLSGIRPISLFPAWDNPLPVGEIPYPLSLNEYPRTHILALMAARQALDCSLPGPEALIVGTTTGGMPATEALLREQNSESQLYRFHGTGTVADILAQELNIPGQTLTVTNACSSGTVAIALAANLIRSGGAHVVLAGGADALCRLTYYGFNSLQLIDPAGARPFDASRRGMSVAEGAAFLLLSDREEDAPHAFAEILGSGMSCDAYHPATPHPEGAGALNAMRAALQDAGISPGDIDYINLHGTGTIDNDLAEGKAIRVLFGETSPLVSSTKGATGHSLAASGAVEAVISCLSIKEGMAPGNTGCSEPDHNIPVTPLLAPVKKNIGCVLSNSFGFGGNNASIVLSRPEDAPSPDKHLPPVSFEVIGMACLTGAGSMDETLEALSKDRPCQGLIPGDSLVRSFPPKEVRRMKRLSRMALTLAHDAIHASRDPISPRAVLFGTSWGPLSETNDFLMKLYESGEQFTSPTDFVGSVHNAPAGLTAIHCKAEGPNITLTGGYRSFAHALQAASLIAGTCEGPYLLINADEYHARLTPLFDPQQSECEYGGALMIQPYRQGSGLLKISQHYIACGNCGDHHDTLISFLGGDSGGHIYRYAAVMTPGNPFPGGYGAINQQLAELTRAGIPIINYGTIMGVNPAATGAIIALAAKWMEQGTLPSILTGKEIAIGNRALACIIPDRISSIIVMER